MNRLDGKVAFISGAARGIGAATARLMVEAGAKVAIGDVLDERGRETAQGIAGTGGAATYHHLDVTREEDWTAAVAATVARFGGLDILVNNAGLFLGKGIEEASLEEWHRLCAVNLTGVFLGTKHALPALREHARQSPHGSAIVNLASVAGLVGSQLDPLYSMTKGGVTLFTKSTALEFARKGYRVRVNSIHPGLIQTPQGACRPSGSCKESISGRKQTKVVLACDTWISTNKSGRASASRHLVLHPYRPRNAAPTGAALPSRGQRARRPSDNKQGRFFRGES